jgi:hypothetical protein
MKILFLNLHARVEPFITHKKAQEKTWAKNIASEVFWVVGNPEILTNAQVNGNELEIAVDEEFGNILLKSVEAIKWALLNRDFDFVVRGNTSNYYDVEVMADFLSRINPEEDFAGSEIGYTNYNKDTKLNPGKYLSGTGIVLSRKTAQIFQDMKVKDYEGWPDDAAMSHFVSQNNVPFSRIPRGDITDFKPIEFTSQYRVKSWSSIDYASRRMHDLDGILKSNLITSIMRFIVFSSREYWRYSRYFPLHRGLNCVRHLRQIYWISKSILNFPNLKLKHLRLTANRESILKVGK